MHYNFLIAACLLFIATVSTTPIFSSNNLNGPLSESQDFTCKKHDQPSQLDSELVDDVINSGPVTLRREFIHLSDPFFKDVCSKSLLFVGKTGTGKTISAKAIAQKLGKEHTFISMTKLGNEYQNSQKRELIKHVCPIIDKKQPHTIILDQVDSFTDNSSAICLADLLDMAKLQKNITVIATAQSIKNLPEMISHRFVGTMIYFEKPNWQQRRKLIEKYFAVPHKLSEWSASEWIFWQRICWETRNWSQQQIVIFAKAAHIAAIVRTRKTNQSLVIVWEDCCKAFESVNQESADNSLNTNHV